MVFGNKVNHSRYSLDDFNLDGYIFVSDLKIEEIVLQFQDDQKHPNAPVLAPSEDRKWKNRNDKMKIKKKNENCVSKVSSS